MAQTQTQKREIVTLNGQDYYVDSFTDESQIALAQIAQIEVDMEKTKISLRNLEYAKQFLVEHLGKNVDQFEKVQESKETQETK